MKSFKVNPIGASINTEIKKEFWFKIHITTGPAFHTEFKFTIKSNPSSDEFKRITFKVKRNIKSALRNNSTKTVERHFDELVKSPFEKGIQRFIEHLNRSRINISTDLRIEIFEYVFHAIDSKPIANELGVEIALKSVFGDQLNFDKDKRIQMEEIY